MQLEEIFGAARMPQIIHELGQEQARSPANREPACSQKRLVQLPHVTISEEDLTKESTNAECAICLREQAVGEEATKLPCGHLFCRGCIEDWLSRSCACPVCRYELETDDAEFELGRKERMVGRKVRFTVAELERCSTRELQAMLTDLDIPSAGCLEKADLVARLAEGGLVELLPPTPSGASASSS